MKTLLTISVIIGIFIYGCGDDENNTSDSESTSSNYIKIGDEKIIISTAYLSNNGTKEEWIEDDYDFDGYFQYIDFFSSGLSYYENNFDYSGVGDEIYFEITSPTGTTIEEGIYNITQKKPTPIGYCMQGYHLIDYNAKYESDYEDDTAINEGYIKIEKKDDIYIIRIDCIDEKGEIVTGYYNGKLKYYKDY